jgi:hypothetical protein
MFCISAYEMKFTVMGNFAASQHQQLSHCETMPSNGETWIGHGLHQACRVTLASCQPSG